MCDCVSNNNDGWQFVKFLQFSSPFFWPLFPYTRRLRSKIIEKKRRKVNFTYSSMGISNPVGSSSFDILVCMGLPWLIKAAAMPEYPEEGNFVAVNSGGVVISVAMLFITNLVLYFSIFFNKFLLDRKIGFILLITYIIFLVLAGCLEVNVFFPVNPPPCPH